MGQITKMAEENKVQYFIDGLKKETSAEMSYSAPKNSEDAIKIAI